MTIYRTCFGCLLQSDACTTRDDMRHKLAGLGVTSIKWRCKDRKPRFVPGDPVFARTVDGTSTNDEDGRPIWDDFPGFVVRVTGTKALLFIDPGIEGDSGDTTFSAGHNGFCKIPLSRIRTRTAPRETICRYCEQPSFKGHIAGFSCEYVERLKTERSTPF